MMYMCCFQPTSDGSHVNLNIGIPGVDAEVKDPCRMTAVGGYHAAFRAGQVLPVVSTFLSTSEKVTFHLFCAFLTLCVTFLNYII